VHGQAAPSWQDGPTCVSYLYISMAFGACRESKRISLVTTAGRCFFIIAQRSECRGEKQNLVTQTKRLPCTSVGSRKRSVCHRDCVTGSLGTELLSHHDGCIRDSSPLPIVDVENVGDETDRVPFSAAHQPPKIHVGGL
jgi:hypothetical protein